jgi:BMFP domain-containing protein YqiC
MSIENTQPAQDDVRAELAEKEEQLRKLVRQIDVISRAEFRDRAQRLKQMREQRLALEKEIDALKAKLK